MTKKYDWSLLILRVILGLGFTIHGFDKFNGGIENISNWFDSIGIPGILAYGVSLLEVMGGIALIAGLATKLVSCLFAIVMIVAIIKVKIVGGFLGNGELSGFELELVYFTISIALFINGSRLFSIDETLFPSRTRNIKKIA